jgi:hypothetical protein
MKTHLAAAAAALVLCISAPVASFASVQAGDLINLSRQGGVDYGTSGGEFRALQDSISDADTALDDGEFRTFCVEIGEHISLGSTYKVLSTGLTTKQTGSTLGSFAAWLYSAYLDNTLGITVDTHAEANTIQIGIWRSMGYLGTSSDLPNPFGGINSSPIGAAGSNWSSSLLATFDAMYAAAIANFSWGGGTPDAYGNIGTYTGQVQIMNLVGTGASVSHHQDQLFRDPGINNPPPPFVPEPMSFLVWSMLAMCVGTLGMRRRD